VAEKRFVVTVVDVVSLRLILEEDDDEVDVEVEVLFKSGPSPGLLLVVGVVTFNISYCFFSECQVFS